MAEEFSYDWPWLKAKLIKHFLPLGLAFALFWSLVWPMPGREVRDAFGRWGWIFAVDGRKCMVSILRKRNV